MARGTSATAVLATVALLLVAVADARPGARSLLRPAATGAVSVDSSQLTSNGQYVTVTWSLSAPKSSGKNDQINVWTKEAYATRTPSNPIAFPTLPIKYKAIPLNTATGSTRFRLLNVRDDYVISLSSSTAASTYPLTGGAGEEAVAIIVNTIPNSPEMVHASPGAAPDTVLVQWVTRDRGSPVLAWGPSPAVQQRSAPATTVTTCSVYKMECQPLNPDGSLLYPIHVNTGWGGPTSVDSLAVNSTTGKPDYSYIAVTSSLTPKWGFVHLAATKLRLTLRAVPVDLTQNAGTPVTYTGSYAPLAPIDEITILARPHGPRQKGRPASASAVHAG